MAGVLENCSGTMILLPGRVATHALRLCDGFISMADVPALEICQGRLISSFLAQRIPKERKESMPLRVQGLGFRVYRV